MTIEYKDSKRIVALQADISKNIVTINHRCSTTDDHAYADLGSALSNTSWVMRYKMVISGLSSSSANPNNSYLFAISKTNANNMVDQSLGLKLRIGGGSGYLNFMVSGGTSSQNGGEGYDGSLFSSTTVANGTWYVEYIRNGSSFSIRLTTSSDYTGGELDTWSTSGTVEDLRYIKYTNRDDNTSSHVCVSTISDIKIYDGVTSATGTFVRDGTWTASASNKVTVALESNKPTDVQDNSLLIEKDTANRYWFTPTVEPANSANFDGLSSDHIDIPTTGLTSLANGSVSFWLNVATDTPNSGDNVVFSCSNSSTGSSEWVIGYYGSTNKISVLSRNNGSNVVSYQAGSLAKGTWYHIVYTNSSSTGNKLYINGSVVTPSYSQGSASTNAFMSSVSSINTCNIGANKDNGGYQWGMDGNIQQVLVYGSTLTSSEVTALYNSGNYNSSPSATNLLRRYELTSNVNDTSGNGHNGTATGVTFTSEAIPNSPTTTTNTWTEDLTGVTSALTVDNFTVGTNTQASSTGTQSHIVSASSKEKKILLVTVRTAGVDSTQSACTYAGVAMTSLGTAICGTGNYTRQTCFYLLDPPTGTADIVVTKSNSGAHCKIIALSLYGAKQSAPTFAINSGNFSPTAGITTNITPPANSWVYSSLSGSDPINSSTNPPSTYYTNAELTVLNSDTSVTKKKYGLKKDPTTGSTNAVKMYFKHSANNNNQPVVLSAFAVEHLG